MQQLIFTIIALLLLALIGADSSQAQNAIIHYGTVEGRIDIPLKTAGSTAPPLGCANLRVAYYPVSGGAAQEVKAQPAGVGACAYKLPPVVVGKPYNIGLNYVGPGNYRVRFNNGLSSWRVIVTQPNQTLTYNFTQLKLEENPQ